MSGINWFDIIILVLSVLLGLKGILNGLIREFCALCGIVGGVLLASRFASKAALIINQFYKIDNDTLAVFAGFIVILFGVWLSFLILGTYLVKLTYFSGLGFFDRFGGFIFGAAKIFFIFAILTAAISNVAFLSVNLAPYVQNSKIYPYLIESGNYIMKSQVAIKGEELVRDKLKDLDLNTSKKNVH